MKMGEYVVSFALKQPSVTVVQRWVKTPTAEQVLEAFFSDKKYTDVFAVLVNQLKKVEVVTA